MFDPQELLDLLGEHTEEYHEDFSECLCGFKINVSEFDDPWEASRWWYRAHLRDQIMALTKKHEMNLTHYAVWDAAGPEDGPPIVPLTSLRKDDFRG